MQEYFTTGELSELFHINVQTLHYYDSIGLLTPTIRDSHIGKRLYSFEQVYKFTTIRYQQKLGKSLKQIADYMGSTDMTDVLNDLKQQLDIVHRKMDELRVVGQTIEEKVSFIEQKFEEMNSVDVDSIKYETFPERPYFAAEGDEFQFGNDFFYVYPTVVFHEHGNKSFGVFVPDDFYEKHPLSQLTCISAGTYICGYHLGTYETIFDSIDRLRNLALQKGQKVSDRTVCFNIIDQFVEPDSTKYLTQLQIQIL
ncbi:MerR family transcriptional regulator [uncultured Sphaerochaeta sp.]|uniref:MerR family transcriptional regulator n=1 Tax=uncultured Sphaerochaeta sp. TaxID=886478 RepID=UPI002A0A2A9B|nr:MerR family transcriptional regulator [uncultured Sphaerochaeta sp.]